MFESGLKGGIKGLSGAMYTRPKSTKGSQDFSSAQFRKSPFMRKKKSDRIVAGMRGSQAKKSCISQRIESAKYNQKKRHDPNFSWDEGNEVVAETKKMHGPKVAKEVERVLQGAFRGRHSISNREAEMHLSSIGQYGKDIREDIGLIAKGKNQKFQSGPGANYLTEEKLESIIKDVAKTNKYAAHSLEEQFMVTRQKKGGGGSSFGSSARRSGSTMAPEAKKEMGSASGSASGNTMNTPEAAKENLSRSSMQPRENMSNSSPSLSRADLKE
jgi:hypothetical protein